MRRDTTASAGSIPLAPAPVTSSDELNEEEDDEDDADVVGGGGLTFDVDMVVAERPAVVDMPKPIPPPNCESSKRYRDADVVEVVKACEM